MVGDDLRLGDAREGDAVRAVREDRAGGAVRQSHLHRRPIAENRCVEFDNVMGGNIILAVPTKEG